MFFLTLRVMGLIKKEKEKFKLNQSPGRNLYGRNPIKPHFMGSGVPASQRRVGIRKKASFVNLLKVGSKT